MAFKKVCDNVLCESEIDVNKYGDHDKEEVQWLMVNRPKQFGEYDPETDDLKIVKEELELEYCSVKCLVAEMQRMVDDE